jgi:cysteine desulfurase
MDQIYLDYNSTTPVDPRVLEAMLPFFSEKFGNAASHTHRWGWSAAAVVDKARQEVAELIHAGPEEIIFTSGATEAINLAMRGVMDVYSVKGKHLLVASTEHKAVLDTAADLVRTGA